MEKYILSIDVGTTSLRTLAYNTSLHKFQNANSVKIQSYYPKENYVEQDALQIAKDVKLCLEKTIQNIDENLIVGAGLTNQRETIVLWNKETGIPIYNALVWQDKRTNSLCEKYRKDKVISNMLYQKTGLLCDAYFSASKLAWLLENIPVAKTLLETHNLCAGTLDSYIIFYLTNGKSFVTDHTNASRTLLYNIHTMDFDDELLKFWEIPKEILPQIVNNDSIIGETIIAGKKIKLGGMIGDQQSSLFGQSCFDISNGKITYGTGAFILFNIGNKPIIPQNNLLTTVAWKTKKQTSFAVECSIYSASACINWMKDQLGLIDKMPEIEKFANNINDCGGVSFIPALSGLGAPFWNNDVKAGIYGLTFSSTKQHIVRAILCGIANNVKCAYDHVATTLKLPLTEIKVDGGMSVNDTFLQIQSDLLNQKIVCSKELESTGLGAVFMCGLAFGFFKDISELKTEYKHRKIFTPQKNLKLQEEYQNWLEIVNANISNK